MNGDRIYDTVMQHTAQINRIRVQLIVDLMERAEAKSTASMDAPQAFRLLYLSDFAPATNGFMLEPIPARITIDIIFLKSSTSIFLAFLTKTPL